jgi:hypothetical protein
MGEGFGFCVMLLLAVTRNAVRPVRSLSRASLCGIPPIHIRFKCSVISFCSVKIFYLRCSSTRSDSYC